MSEREMVSKWLLYLSASCAEWQVTMWKGKDILYHLLVSICFFNGKIRCSANRIVPEKPFKLCKTAKTVIKWHS